MHDLVPRLLAFGLALAIAVSPAQARSHGPDADTLFRKAVALADAGKYAEAVERFEESYRAEPALGTLLGLAMAEQSCSRLLSALRHYRMLVELARKTDDSERERLAQSRIASLQAAIPTITVRLSAPLPAGAGVQLDGAPVSDGAAVPVDPGTHTVTSSGPGVEHAARSLTVTAGAREVVTWRVVQASQAPAPARKTDASRPVLLRGLGIGAGVLGTAAVLAGGALWMQSNTHYERASNMCPGPECQTRAHQSIESGRGLQQAAGVCLAIGGVSLAAGVTLWMAGSRGAGQAQARLDVGPGSVQMTGVF